MAAETKEVQTSQAEPEEQKAAKRKLPNGRAQLHTPKSALDWAL